jgi:two-component system, OmpR family, heavy metal sensor histidine kinase CusS
MSSKRAGDAAAGWSLAARLTLWYAGSTFALVLATTVYLSWALAGALERENDEFLADQVHILRVLMRDHPDDEAGLREEVEWESEARQYARVFARVLDANGARIAETHGMPDALAYAAFPPPSDVDEEPARGANVCSPTGASFRVMAARAVVGAPDGIVRLVQVALERKREENLLSGFRLLLWPVLAISLVVCALAGHHVARRGIRPLEEITDTARRMRPTTLHERIGTAGLPAEIAALAVTFNGMLDRLEDAFGRLSRFSADIAHELRTPLNNLRGEAEVTLGRARSPEVYREALVSCLEESVRLSSMIDSLLFLARSENPEMRIRREPLDVGHELKTIGDFYGVPATEAGIDIRMDAPAGLTAHLDRGLFQRAVGNLLDNALAHTPTGGSVTVSVAGGDDAIRVTVADTGCGIAPEHLSRVFDRFYRVDVSRSSAKGSAGLGLSIVKSIVELHGGSVSIASEPGFGTRVTLLFPRSAPAR